MGIGQAKHRLMSDITIDILEHGLSPKVLETLLCDHTTGRNIFWATHDYEALGEAINMTTSCAPNRLAESGSEW